jgi:hypothetical protein
MKRFVGLSLMCLVFVSVQADSSEVDSNFKGSSWSLYMSQDGDEPIQVQSERKEYDKNGMTVHKKSQGIIDRDGIYKPIDERDFKSPFKKRSFFGCDLQKRENQFEHDKFLRNQHKVNPQKKHGGLWKVLAYPFVKEDNENSQEKAFQKKRLHCLHPKFAGPEENNMEEKLSRRSRVSFYRPVEKMFEKIFGRKSEREERWRPHEKGSSFEERQNQDMRIQQLPFEHKSGKRFPFGFKHNQNSRMENPPFQHDQASRVKPSMRLRPVKRVEQPRRHWFDDFERRQQAMWEQMRELEKSFFGDFYGEEE